MHPILQRLGTALLASLTLAPCAAQPAPAAAPVPAPARPADDAPATIVGGKIGERMDDYLSRLEAYGFECAVLYARKDKISLRKAYGYASSSERRRNTLDTLFDIASVSKQFTCAAILRLQMQGKLSTDDPVTKYLPGLGDDKKDIALFHLMNQTSGLAPDAPVTAQTEDRDEFIRIMRDTPTVADPGEAWAYNNLNFSLLAAVIEVVSGKPYETFMQEEVFTPAGMKHVHHLKDVLPRGVHSAHAHRGDWELWGAEEGWYSWALRGAAGTLCSVNDLYTWELALRDNRVLSKEATLELFNRCYPAYTYGWFVREDKEERRTYFWHGGNTIGFQAHLERCPKDNSILIVLINMADKVDPVVRGLRSISNGFGADMPPKPAPMDAPTLAKFAGKYNLEGIGEMELSVDDGALVLKDYGPRAIAARLAQRSEADVKRAPRYDTMTKEAIEAWHVGDDTGLEKLFPEGRERLAGPMAGEWRTLAEAGGGLKDVRVLGTIPVSLDELYTYVAIDGHDRTDVVKLIWHDGELMAWDRTYPGSMRFVPTGTAEFVSFEVTNEATPRDRAMKFVLDDQGNPEKVAVLIDFVRLFADRAAAKETSP
jgi:CubicO group peptidase (beta-lactamase class C family)